MSGNKSSTGGYLRQTDAPLPTDDWDNAIAAAVVGITGIDASLVRPRWQPEPPEQPAADVDWCAVGVTSRSGQDYPYQRFDNPGLVQTRWLTLHVLASFYGPNASTLAEQLRDGLYIGQNLEALARSGIKLTDAEPTTRAPELMNLRWIDRVDLPIRLAAAIDRTYDVLSILSSQGTITSNTGVTAAWDTRNQGS